MKTYRLFSRGLILALTFGLAACGGGGGGGGAAGGGAAGPTFAGAPMTSLTAATFGAGLAINDSNVAVGRSDGGVTNPTILKAVAWTVTPGTAPAAPTSTLTELALPASHGPSGSANGINAAGAIAGEVEVTASGLFVPAFWPTKDALAAQVVLLPLGATATQGAAYSINTAGQIAGEVVDGGVTKAVTWATSAATAPTMLPTSAGTTASSAYAVNSNGEIVGELTDATGTHAVVWRAVAGVYGAPIMLSAPGTLAGDSIAMSINTAGNIVGEIEDTATGLIHAVRWTRGTGTAFTAADLGPAGVNSTAAGLNDGDRVVGHANNVASTWAAAATAPTSIDATQTNSMAFGINNILQPVVVGISAGQAVMAVTR